MSTPKINICKACQQEVPELKFGYCSACNEDMEKADLHLAIRNHIPKDWRIGQFIFNFLVWLRENNRQDDYLLIGSTAGITDTSHLSDDDFIRYWQDYLKSIIQS